MTITRHDFPTLPPETERLAWCQWLQHHTINPNHVVVTNGFIEVDNDTRQTKYLAYDLNEHGSKYIDPDSDPPAAAAVVRVVQLEARPSPLPV